ncbi:hypothetical protein BKA63DRAFT_559665 [Paraphoma chrysanthemicola]|nr:hypothetical protein BKA63DRAFT_559665 [Paraphoma chrysanthemicola]
MADQFKCEDEKPLPSEASCNASNVHEEFEPDGFSSGTAAQSPSTKLRSTHKISVTADAVGVQGSLQKKQIRLLRLWHEEFTDLGPGSRPPKEHIEALALVICAQPHLVAEFFEQGLWRLDDETGYNYDITDGDRTPSRQFRHSKQPYTLAQANSHLNAMTLASVEKYVSACRRRRSQNDGRRSVNTGPFKCTFGCGYRTKRAFDWRRHEETHEPQELWLCIICIQRDANNPFLVNRKDKFLKHTTDKHADYPLEKVLEESKVDFVPRAEWSCVYCGDENDSWDDRCRHVLAHFEDEAERGVKRPRVAMEGRGDDEPSHGDSASVGSVGSDGVDHGDPS